MANNRNTYQQEHTISVKRDKIVDIASRIDLGKKDLRVFLILLTQLDGYSYPETRRVNGTYRDPLNFKKIDIEQMSDILSMSKKDVKKSVEFLNDEGIIERGSNDTIKNGYRFTF